MAFARSDSNIPRRLANDAGFIRQAPRHKISPGLTGSDWFSLQLACKVHVTISRLISNSHGQHRLPNNRLFWTSSLLGGRTRDEHAILIILFKPNITVRVVQRHGTFLPRDRHATPHRVINLRIHCIRSIQLIKRTPGTDFLMFATPTGPATRNPVSQQQHATSILLRHHWILRVGYLLSIRYYDHIRFPCYTRQNCCRRGQGWTFTRGQTMSRWDRNIKYPGHFGSCSMYRKGTSGSIGANSTPQILAHPTSTNAGRARIHIEGYCK